MATDTVETPAPASAPPDAAASRLQETWAASRAREQQAEKERMAADYAEHCFLVPEGGNPVDPRETAASILVNQGTTPNVVVREALGWIEVHAAEGPFHITWYSPGTLVSATLHDFRQRNPHLSASSHIHLFPGTVDLQLQAVVGPETQDYARKISRRFSCMLLSGHSFDLNSGVVRFNFDREIPIQKTCALLEARQKFLFFDSKKFTGEGEVGYSLQELLATSKSVTIYTVAPEKASDLTSLQAAIKSLCSELFSEAPVSGGSTELKSLRLKIVGGNDHPPDFGCYRGYLRQRAA